jgi:hypothetical protein
MIPVHLRSSLATGKRCPHADIKHCPLYHAAHAQTDGLHCVDNVADGFNGCAVDRGALKYDQLYAALVINHPVIVAECEWIEAKDLRGRQIDRNIRLNGIH